MLNQQTQSAFILLITAMIWGFAFPFQRQAMEFMGPFSFMAVRFSVGSISLLPLLCLSFYFTKKNVHKNPVKESSKIYWIAGISAGACLFLGAALQQVGLIYTTSGKAGFITGLYLIVVPILCVFIGQKIFKNTWFSVPLAIIGLFLISRSDIEGQLFDINIGDVYTLICTVFWASQIIILGWASPKTEGTKLAFYQFIVCALLSWAAAILIEGFYFFNDLDSVKAAAIPILFTGIVSTGVAFTLQIIGQKNMASSPAAVIMSLEAVFAAIAGWALLNETMSFTTFLGCCFMFAGMLVSQLLSPKNQLIS